MRRFRVRAGAAPNDGRPPTASAALRGWQDTIAGRAPVQPPLCLPEWRLSRSDLCTPATDPRLTCIRALILILSLAPRRLGIGRFAYALVLPDMRDALGWSYSAAGFMNTSMPRAISPAP